MAPQRRLELHRAIIHWLVDESPCPAQEYRNEHLLDHLIATGNWDLLVNKSAIDRQTREFLIERGTRQRFSPLQRALELAVDQANGCGGVGAAGPGELALVLKRLREVIELATDTDALDAAGTGFHGEELARMSWAWIRPVERFLMATASFLIALEQEVSAEGQAEQILDLLTAHGAELADVRLCCLALQICVTADHQRKHRYLSGIGAALRSVLDDDIEVKSARQVDQWATSLDHVPSDTGEGERDPRLRLESALEVVGARGDLQDALALLGEPGGRNPFILARAELDRALVLLATPQGMADASAHVQRAVEACPNPFSRWCQGVQAACGEIPLEDVRDPTALRLTAEALATESGSRRIEELVRAVERAASDAPRPSDTIELAAAWLALGYPQRSRKLLASLSRQDRASLRKHLCFLLPRTGAVLDAVLLRLVLQDLAGGKRNNQAKQINRLVQTGRARWAGPFLIHCVPGVRLRDTETWIVEACAKRLASLGHAEEAAGVVRERVSHWKRPAFLARIACKSLAHGEVKHAQRLLEEAQRISGEVDDPKRAGRLARAVTLFRAISGDPDPLANFRAFLTRERQDLPEQKVARLVEGVALDLFYAGRLDQALKSCAILSDELGHPREGELSCQRMGEVLATHGQLAEAEGVLDHLRSSLARAVLQAHIGTCKIILGEAGGDLRQVEAGHRSLGAALFSTRHELSGKEQVTALHSIARLEGDAGMTYDAEAHIKEAMELARTYRGELSHVVSSAEYLDLPEQVQACLAAAHKATARQFMEYRRFLGRMSRFVHDRRLSCEGCDVGVQRPAGGPAAPVDLDHEIQRCRSLFERLPLKYRTNAVYSIAYKLSADHARHPHPDLPKGQAPWVRPFVLSLLPACAQLPEAAAALLIQALRRSDSADELRAVLSRVRQ